jgi:hypothetical protein
MNVHARIAQALETSLSTTPTRFMKAWMEPGLERISPNLFEFATLKGNRDGRPRHQRRPSWRGRVFHTAICVISGISESLGARDISPERAPGG